MVPKIIKQITIKMDILAFAVPHCKSLEATIVQRSQSSDGAWLIKMHLCRAGH